MNSDTKKTIMQADAHNSDLSEFTQEEISLYSEIISEIVKYQAEVLGKDVALKKAAKVTGVRLNENFQVFMLKENPLQVIQSLVNEYFSLSSDWAIRITQKALKKFRDENPALKLPQILISFKEDNASK